MVPLTTFQEGTVLMTLADMSTLEFKGTVDEIDVGKLTEGMPVRIQVGALPGKTVAGKLTRIAPKAREKEGATVFDVEVAIDAANAEIVLRAGYSANADVIIQEKKDVLLIPERLVTLDGGKSFVEVPAAKPDAEPEKKEIQVGLSDGLNMEVLAGPRRRRQGRPAAAEEDRVSRWRSATTSGTSCATSARRSCGSS